MTFLQTVVHWQVWHLIVAAVILGFAFWAAYWCHRAIDKEESYFTGLKDGRTTRAGEVARLKYELALLRGQFTKTQKISHVRTVCGAKEEKKH